MKQNILYYTKIGITCNIVRKYVTKTKNVCNAYDVDVTIVDTIEI